MPSSASTAYFCKPGFTQLFVVASDGGAPRQLTTGDFAHGDIRSVVRVGKCGPPHPAA